MTQLRNVVLVHGGFVDGSGWQGLYNLLRADGFNVSVVQNPTLSLTDDNAVTRRVLDKQDGPTILVGHSYGGAVITEAGTHDNVAGLAYVAAFAPDQGESVGSLIGGFPQDGPQPPILPPQGRPRCVHGRRPGSMGRRGNRRSHHRSSLAEQAQLVPRRKRRPHDPPGCPAPDVRTDRRNRDRDPRQPCRVRLQPRRRRQPDRSGGTDGLH